MGKATIEESAQGGDFAAATFSWKKAPRARIFGRKRTFLLVCLVALVVTTWYLHKQGLITPERIRALVDTRPVLSLTVFVLGYGFLILTVFPTVPFNMAAGVFWGPWWGGLIVAAGASAGSITAFILSRTVIGERVAARVESRLLKSFQREFDEHAWLYLALIRLNPVFPTGAMNYVLGLTSVRLSTFSWATILFLIPPSLIFSSIGHFAGQFVLEGQAADLVRLVLIGSGGVTILAALVIVLQRIRKRRARS